MSPQAEITEPAGKDSLLLRATSSLLDHALGGLSNGLAGGDDADLRCPSRNEAMSLKRTEATKVTEPLHVEDFI